MSNNSWVASQLVYGLQGRADYEWVLYVIFVKGRRPLVLKAGVGLWSEFPITESCVDTSNWDVYSELCVKKRN